MSLEQVTQKLRAGQPVRFATFGDSITWPCFHTDFRQNYLTFVGDALRQAYPAAKLEIVHAGNMGTAARGLEGNRFDRSVLSHRPDAVFIMFGMNDCAAGPVGLDAYDRNLTELIRKTQSAGAVPVLVTQNEIIYDSTDGQRRSALPLYMARAMEVAAREKVPAADCFALWKPLLGNREQLIGRLNDWIHPNLAGHRLLARGILHPFWPEADHYVSADILTPAVPGTPDPMPCLLPGPAGKQILRLADGTWLALSARRRGNRITDLRFAYTTKADPAWSDFKHITVVGQCPGAVFDHQDRTLTAGLLLAQKGRVFVVFSWNVGTYFASLDLTKPDWPHRAHEAASWMEHTTEPFVRPTALAHSSRDGAVLYDAFVTPESGWPAVLCSDFELAPGAGYERVEGQEGISLATAAPEAKRATRQFVSVGEGQMADSAAPLFTSWADSSTEPHRLALLVDKGGRLEFSLLPIRSAD